MKAEKKTLAGRVRMDYKNAAEKELKEILSWWNMHMPDEKNGGFYGSVNNENIPDLSAPRGIVLYSRILWTFSAASACLNQPTYLLTATRAFNYIMEHFTDDEYGGVYWSVDASGNMIEGRKQIYGLAFCIYGMSEYFRATKNRTALKMAQELVREIEKHSYDKENGGYIEAFDRNWDSLENLRLSEKDQNERKTMNTHLHLIEAYANLYCAMKEPLLKERISHLLAVFKNYFFNGETHHMNLFMDEHWHPRSSLVSYGHDIEAAWLLLQCAETIEDERHTETFKNIGISLVNAAVEGLDADGGLWYESDPDANLWVRQKHSWPQAEAMVGFYNAYQLTGEEKYLHMSKNSFEFIRRKIKDHVHGEWLWGIEEDGSVMNKEKAGFWKCPYHGSRACMEIGKRI